MAQFLFLLFLLSNAFLCLAMNSISNKLQTTDQSISEPPSNSNPPTQTPFNDQKTHTGEPSTGRKLGKHQHNKHFSSSESPSSSPSEAPQSEKKRMDSSDGSVPNHQRNSVEPHYDELLGSQSGEQLLKQHHHSFDKSIAGGGVILGGLATTFLVSVFCYIRATGRQKSENNV